MPQDIAESPYDGMVREMNQIGATDAEIHAAVFARMQGERDESTLEREVRTAMERELSAVLDA